MNNTIYAADLFCGAGGTSTGLSQAAAAMGKKLSLVAVNHWTTAIETHSRNHPDAMHYCESLDNLDPRALVKGGRLHLLVASPECTHHSNARGGKPMCNQSRSTAWHILRWAEALYIDNILIENVPEFQTWGPLGADGRPLKSKKGATYQAFVTALESLGYRVSARVLTAANYGDPTTRKRLFLLASRGKRRAVFPEATHVEASKAGAHLRAWVPAREIIDWRLQGESIFDRKKPLSENTMRRIKAGIAKYWGEPFFAMLYGTNTVRTLDIPFPTITAGGQHVSLVEPFIVNDKYSSGITSRVRSADAPLQAITADPRMGIAVPFIIPQFTPLGGRSIDRPLNTITTQSRGIGLVEPFIVSYYGQQTDSNMASPLPTITTMQKHALVELLESRDARLDVRYRMLQPHELAAAMSFPSDYQFAGNKSEVVKQIGNAVPVRTARALCEALLGRVAA